MIQGSATEAESNRRRNRQQSTKTPNIDAFKRSGGATGETGRQLGPLQRGNLSRVETPSADFSAGEIACLDELDSQALTGE